MIHKIKNRNKGVSAFTLIEMVIVLVIIGILLMSTMYLSGEQVQKVRDKTVKESILAEWQSRYSRNLGSSSFASKMYKYMDISITSGDNRILFDYAPRNDDEGIINNTFTNKFTIEKIITNPENQSNYNESPNITFRYTPYQISCERGIRNDGGDFDNLDMNNKLLFIARVNDSRDYCFEINKKNCRLMEVANERCGIIETLSNNQ